MFFPKYIFGAKQTPSSGVGSGSVSHAVEKAKERKSLGKWRFSVGAPADLQLGKCPGCGEESCHYIGGGPKDVECINRSCQFFKLPPNMQKPTSKDVIDDLGIGFGD